MEYMTATSYKDYERIGTPYVKDGKMYTKVKGLCPRCSGRGLIISRIENGQPIPIPVDGGVCYQCLGQKYIYKDVRLYTEKEFAQMEAAKERAAAKREEERREKMVREFAQKKENWLKKNGFNEEGKTYVVTGDSYSIKDDLKSAGYIYDKVLRWHCADPGAYADRVVEIDVNDVVEFSAWGEGHYFTSSQEFVSNKIAPEPEEGTTSEWVGNIGDRIKLTLTLVKTGYCTTRFGGSNIYTFKDEDGNDITWFTSVALKKEVGDTFDVKATIKAHNDYKGKKQTLISRATVM